MNSEKQKNEVLALILNVDLTCALCDSETNFLTRFVHKIILTVLISTVCSNLKIYIDFPAIIL